MKAQAIVNLNLPSRKLAASMMKALEPEIKRPPYIRSKTTIDRDEMVLILEVEAEDTVALRATLNAYLRWINATLNVLDVLKKRH